MDSEGLVKTFAIAVALSGWFKVLYDHMMAKPKISGRILCVMKGQLNLDGYPPMTSFLLYPYLLNSSKSSVHILDYELFASYKKIGWKKMHRLYSAERLMMDFSSQGGGEIKISNFAENILSKKNLPAQYGIPLHGWAPFVGNASFYGEEALVYKLVCIDAYGKKHVIKQKNDGSNLMLLTELTGIKLPPEMYNAPSL